MGMGISTEINQDLTEVIKQTKTVVAELLMAAAMEPGDILVVGCSSSEIAHHRIGSFSSAEIGDAVYLAIQEALEGTGICLAAQCCEHLNRAIILEKAVAKQHDFTIVNVVPQLKAGGSFAAAAYRHLQQPVAIETVRAQAGIDIGDTLIGMHLVPVAVPVRTSVSTIGNAHVVCARTRPKYIGGERASYK